MKTSNRLLLGLLIVVLVGLISTNFILKAEYEDIRAHPRPAEGFRFVEVATFSHVNVNSLSPGIRFHIQQGPRVLVEVKDSLATQIKTRVQNDTLFVDLPATVRVSQSAEPGMLITSTQLVSVTFENGLGSVAKWQTQTARLALHNQSRVNLWQNHLQNLYVTAYDRSICTLEGNENWVKNVSATKSDSSQIKVEGISIGLVHKQP